MLYSVGTIIQHATETNKFATLRWGRRCDQSKICEIGVGQRWDMSSKPWRWATYLYGTLQSFPKLVDDVECGLCNLEAWRVSITLM